MLNVSIQSKEAIKSIYCPSDDARIDRTGDRDVRVSLERRDIVPSRDFRLVYTLADGAFSASVLSIRPTESEDGYFLLLASPEVKPADTRPLPKTVIFVIDRSGSMAGKKIEQARKALKSVLNNLRDEDLFNIVAYDDRVESFKPELQRYSSKLRDEAERFVDNIREGGSTNIDSALKTAVAMIQDSIAPELRAVSHRRAADGRRDARAVDRRKLPHGQWARDRGSSASESATTSTPACSIG